MKPQFRKALLEDAEGISHIWGVICSERVYSSVIIPFTVQQESKYMLSQSEREGVFIAEKEEEIVGFQSLDLWSKVINTFDHVGTIGTFILPKWRGTGIAYSLADYTFNFGRLQKYEKVIAYVRKENTRAIKFYKNLGFEIKGELKRQVKIDNVYEDEVFMELFL